MILTPGEGVGIAVESERGVVRVGAGEIPEGYSNAVINEQTGKVELKEPMEGANESWPDVNRRSTKK